ncbi:MAG: multiheme c-type cytochrome [Blastocatellales bacterium]
MNKRLIKLVVLLTALAGFGQMSGWMARPLTAAIAQAQQWQPNQPSSGARYVGSQACAQCHQSKSKAHAGSAMAQALATPAEAAILRDHTRLSFRNGQWAYRITREGDRSLYTVSDGVNDLTVPILWAFGRGTSGQTYVIRHDGIYYETRVSFFTTLRALDFTPGAPRQAPPSLPVSLKDAIGQPLSHPDAMACFGCHATIAPGAQRFQLDNFTPGVTCEACHGPGEKHVALMKAEMNAEKPPADKAIFNPRRMHPDEMSQQFCGACHRSWEAVMQMPERGGMSNVRFQPYRIANSRCYKNPDDRRISCTACHDAHEDPRHDAAFYDAKCLACHQAKNSPPAKDRIAPPCPTGKAQCATCHMPKIEPPGLHFKFTDHQIRVVKPNEPYPN